jgi:capsular polysaccharide biosynthesis protein
MIEKVVSSQIFPSHSIEYAVPENYNPADRSLFYDENFAFEIPEVHLLTFTQVRVSNRSVTVKCIPVSNLTQHNHLSRKDTCKEIFRSVLLKKENVDLGILGVQDWANNYFHWIAEVLPNIVAIHHHHPDYHVLIPSNYLKYPFVIESLLHLNINVKTFDVHCILQVNKLKAISVPHPGRFNESLMHFFRDKLMHGFTPVNKPFRLLYISRANAKRRKISNEDDVFNLLKIIGFEKVIMENIPFKDGIKLIQEARIVISCHGAGLTNIMFMQKSQTVIELKSNNNNYWCFFSLARVFGLKYYYCLHNGNSKNHRDADILVDINQLKKLVIKAMKN